ncbi:MAG: hypothetical protein IPN29_07305 [Saprospiraceae bacterium]|nr:hypothetical protein [Saprospiraceae bacterium]
MKKYPIILVLFFFYTVLPAQERLTDIHTNTMTFNEISHEYLGRKYVVSIYPLDRLKLFSVVAADSATLLFEREFIGAGFFSGSLRFYKEYLLFQDYTSFYTYHLATGLLNRFPTPEGFETYTNTLFYGENYCLLKLKPPAEAYYLYYILDYQNGISALNPSYGTPVSRNADQFVFHSFYQKNGVQKSRYTVIDIETNESQVIVPEVSRQLQFYYTDEKFWYLYEDGQPRYFDPKTKASGNITGIAFKNFEEYQIYQQDSMLVVLSAKGDDYHILSYDVRNERILAEAKGKAYQSAFMTSKAIFHPTFLLCFDSGYSMFQFDYRRGMLRKYKVSYNPYPISDRIPYVAADVDYLYNGKGFTRIDFNTLDTMAFDLNGINPAVLTSFRTFRWPDQDPLIVLESTHQKAASCHRVDIQRKQVDPINLLHHQLGLPSQAKLLKVGTGMVLFANDLFQVKGRSIQKLNDLPLVSIPLNRNVPKYFTLRHKKLQYTTTDDTFIYVHEFDGKNNKYIGRLSMDPTIEDLVHFKGKFFILNRSSGPNQLTLFDPKTQTSQKIDAGYFGIFKPYNALDLSDNSFLFVMEDFLLYKRDSFFMRVKSDVPEVYHKAPIVCCVGSTITKFNGSWYLQLENDQDIYRMGKPDSSL